MNDYNVAVPYKDPEKQRAYQRDLLAQRRAEWLEENGPCAECGSSDALQTDHKDPKQKVSHNIWSWSKKRRDEELAKCQVLCEDCHQKKTAAENRERNGRLRHGTDTMYGKYKCRCGPCCLARKEAKAANRARRKAEGLPYQ